MDSVSLKIAEICFDDIKETDGFLAICQILATPEPDNNISRLKIKILKNLFDEALKNKEIKSRVKEVLTRSSELPLMQNYHYFGSHPDLVQAVLFKMKTCSDFGISIGNNSWKIIIDREVITELPINQDYEWFRSYVNFAIDNKYQFVLSITESLENETKREKLERFIKELPAATRPVFNGRCTMYCYVRNSFGNIMVFQRYFDKKTGNCRHGKIDKRNPWE